MLHGRGAEQDRIAALVAGARTGRSAALVLRGGPGIGKTALLDWAAELTSPAAHPACVLRASAAEFEAELPFAGLSQLVRPALDRLDRLPGPQRQVLAAAFGLGGGVPADRLLVGLAVLSLLADLAEDGPLLCLVDDAHWLDKVSAEALLFAARRLHAEGVVMIFAARDGSFPAPGLPELTVGALAPADAVRLLDPRLAPEVRMRVLGEAQGNPLALIELPGVLAAGAAEDPLPLTDRLLAAFHGQVDRLPAGTRALLRVAAVEDTGDLDVLLRAAAPLGGGPADLRAAEEARLVEVTGRRLRFRHPLVRAAVHAAAPYPERLAAHRALADVLTAPDTADRRAWHLAAATTGPDEQVAAALERTAEQARGRSGYGAALAAFERAAELSDEETAKARRLLLAAESGLQSGHLGDAVRLAERAAGLVDEPTFHARVAWVEGHAWFWQGGHQTAYDLMTGGAKLDPEQRDALLVAAFHPAWYLGEPHLGACLDQLATLDHPVARYQVAAVRGRPLPLAPTAGQVGGEPRDRVQLCGLGFVAGQDAETYELAGALVARCRADGVLGLLPTLLFFLAEAEFFHGRHRDATVSLDEAVRVARDGGQPLWVSQLRAVQAVLAAVAGDEARCRELVASALDGAAAGAEAGGRAWTLWALGLLDLGHGRAESAVTRLAALQENPYAHQVCAYRSVPDLVEAAVRAGVPERAHEAYARFRAWAERVDQPWAMSLAYRCRALLTGDEQDHLLALKAGGRPFEQARTELLYGEWLRRARRKAEARGLLQRALHTFDRLAAAPWAARARGELEATGLRAPQPAASAGADLTPQELQIARLAGTGLSNRDIAAQLFLSPKTVAYHLYKAYPKLGVAGRGELGELDL
ncbi:helix-turn-helix transcriptional regulator [Micromonospora sp. AMSO31t]|uniref:helix-turn-helix transcriptional regulator n=1 Tax=Micromonospora sp. AMSO31t TaxID=2650566 RepID=UPI00124B68DD|nr:helix-turn-helix transcriptional regulator [Micromonospora sp. AMSO31t]KAB1916423.1 helix-turn-helix domain-containing protein [Micromonospora sp. AMSO31t]